MTALLWDWAWRMLLMGVVVAAFVAVYFIGRLHGRQAQARQAVWSAIELASSETVPIRVPGQREPS